MVGIPLYFDAAARAAAYERWWRDLAGWTRILSSRTKRRPVYYACALKTALHNWSFSVEQKLWWAASLNAACVSVDRLFLVLGGTVPSCLWKCSDEKNKIHFFVLHFISLTHTTKKPKVKWWSLGCQGVNIFVASKGLQDLLVKELSKNTPGIFVSLLGRPQDDMNPSSLLNVFLLDY